jgi:hypothetical protein
MHHSHCGCHRCSNQSDDPFTAVPSLSALSRAGASSPFSQSETLELAAQLLDVKSEQELDHFLGSLVSKAWKGIKQVGRTVAQVAKPLGGVLKPLVKTALPIVGGALGSFIPIPGVGTALGSAVGGMLGNAIGNEVGEVSGLHRDLEVARKIVDVAGTAARNVAASPPGSDPQTLAKMAVVKAMHEHMPQLGQQLQKLLAQDPRTAGRQGNWIQRRSNRIEIFGS